MGCRRDRHHTRGPVAREHPVVGRPLTREGASGGFIVMAPDSFKGTIRAAAAADALRTGWLRVRPDDEVRVAPMADGGEGTLEAIAAAAPGGELMPVTVTGPDGRDVHAAWLRLPDGTGVVELAATSGIELLAELSPLDAHTIGFGQAVLAALDHGVDR